MSPSRRAPPVRSAHPSPRVLERRAGDLVVVADGDLSDNELIARTRAGDDAALVALLTRYRSFARSKAHTYFLVGAEREDVVQEGMIGLYKAVRDFDPSLGTSFRVFADLCISRQVITAVKKANRHKHGPLNSYVPLTGFGMGGVDGRDSWAGAQGLDDAELASVHVQRLHPAAQDPADVVISTDAARGLQQHLTEVLSDLEQEVLRLYVDGESYEEIAASLQRRVKAIDNALQRVKRKLDGHLHRPSLADAR